MLDVRLLLNRRIANQSRCMERAIRLSGSCHAEKGLSSSHGVYDDALSGRLKPQVQPRWEDDEEDRWQE